MEITTSLPAPSSYHYYHRSKVVYKVILQLTVIGLSLLFTSFYETIYNENANNNNQSFQTQSITSVILSYMQTILYESLEWIGEWLPRIVAASLTYHVGFCCLFVGLVYLKVIVPK